MRLIRTLFYICLGFCSHRAISQSTSKGAFSSSLHAALNACQIDGDGASGFNKFGYTLGTVIAQQMGKGWQYETGIAFSERGSRYPFNPDVPGRPAFHYRYSTIDVPLFVNKTLNSSWQVGAGFRTTYLIRARETEGIHLHVAEDSRKTGMLICAKVQYKRTESFSYRLEYQYGLVSVSSNPAGSLFFPTGAYHNCISAGLFYTVSSKTE